MQIQGGIPATWYFAHIGVQVLAVVVALASMILALVQFGDDAPVSKLYTPHRVLGIIAVCEYCKLMGIACLPALPAKVLSAFTCRLMCSLLLVGLELD